MGLVGELLFFDREHDAVSDGVSGGQGQREEPEQVVGAVHLEPVVVLADIVLA